MTDTHIADDDEIELIDILKTMWKWRYLIVGGVIAFGIIAVLISYSLEKIYNISMIVRPGVISTDESGKRVFIDPVETVAGRIEAGIYSDEIIASVFKSSKVQPDHIRLKVNIPNQSEVIRVSYESADKQEGAAVLQELFNQLQNQGKNQVDLIKENLNRKVDIAKIELQKKQELEQAYATNVKNLDRSIQDSRSDIHLITRNNIGLIQERKKLLDKNAKDEKALAVLLYSNTIQQNIQFVNNVNSDLNGKLLRREEEFQKIIQERKEQQKLKGEIQLLEKQRDALNAMTMVRQPVADRYPVKPKKSLIVALAVTAGFFIMTFISFLLEYILSYREIFRRES